MKVILIKDVPNLGSLGDEVQVKAGYARNYLIPQEMAMMVTNKRWKAIQHQRTRLEKLRMDAIQKAQELGQKIKDKEWQVVKKAGSGGKLYGSVTNRELQILFKDNGFDLLRRSIILHEPIKNIGNHEVTVRLHTEVKIPISVKVLPEKGSALESEKVPLPVMEEQGMEEKSESVVAE